MYINRKQVRALIDLEANVSLLLAVFVVRYLKGQVRRKEDPYILGNVFRIKGRITNKIPLIRFEYIGK